MALTYNIPTAFGPVGGSNDTITNTCPSSAPHVVSGWYWFSSGSLPISQDGPSRTAQNLTYDNEWTVTVSPSGPPGVTAMVNVSIICAK